MTWSIFSVQLFPTVMNRRSKIIKGAISVGSFFSAFKYGLTPHSHTSIPQCFLSEKYCGPVHIVVGTAMHSSSRSEMWMGHFLPYATLSINRYKLATSFWKDTVYFCPFLEMEGACSYCSDRVMTVSEKEEKSKPALRQP